MGSPNEDRDPNEVNAHIKVNFEDVFGESEGTQSFDCVWETSNQCYSCSKNCCYNFLALFCGVCFAFCWGFQFAVITFQHVWCIMPGVRLLIINCSAMQKCFGNLMGCIIAPICDTCGLIFSNINIQHVRK